MTTNTLSIRDEAFLIIFVFGDFFFSHPHHVILLNTLHLKANIFEGVVS